MIVFASARSLPKKDKGLKIIFGLNKEIMKIFSLKYFFTIKLFYFRVRTQTHFIQLFKVKDQNCSQLEF